MDPLNHLINSISEWGGGKYRGGAKTIITSCLDLIIKTGSIISKAAKRMLFGCTTPDDSLDACSW